MRTWTNKQIYIHFNWSNLTIPVCVKFVQTRLPISHSKLRFHWPSTEITHVPVWMVSFQGMDTFIYELMYISLSKVITPNGSKYEIPIYLSKPQALGFELIIYMYYWNFIFGSTRCALQHDRAPSCSIRQELLDRHQMHQVREKTHRWVFRVLNKIMHTTTCSYHHQ